MQNSFVETLIGAAVLAVAGVFFFFAWNRTDAGTVQGYELVARFDRVDGISAGTDVRLAGVKIGTVTHQELDQKTYRALLRMNIRSDVNVPEDSSIKVASEGLLGGAYLAVSPGGSDTMMKTGSEFETTQGSIDFVGLLGQAIFGGTDKKDESSTPAPAPTGPAPALATPN